MLNLIPSLIFIPILDVHAIQDAAPITYRKRDTASSKYMFYKQLDTYHVVTAFRHWISARATNSGAVIRLIRTGRASFTMRYPVLAISAHVTRNWKKFVSC